MKNSYQEALRLPQQDVQRLLGKCLLRIQQYEWLLKKLVAHHRVAGPASRIARLQADRIDEASTKTLGMLVRDLLGSYIVPDLGIDAEEDDAACDDVATVSLYFRLNTSPQDYAGIQKDLADLVQLRNRLAHHFIEDHDLGTLEGCLAASSALEASYGFIDRHVDQLHAWADGMEKVRCLMAEHVQSDAFEQFMINGIGLDGTIHWAISGAVRVLRDVLPELAEDGWAPVNAAGRAIHARDPGQVPEKYGCRSWKHVLHASGLFDLQYRDIGGQRVGFYRERIAKLP